VSASVLFNLEIAARAALAVRRNQGGRTTHPVDLLLCIVDHFEPQVGRPAQHVSRSRLEDWIRRYRELASRYRDASGRIPAHSFFYPWDEYDAWEFARLAEHCREGFGEIELHLHHQDDTEATLRAKLRAALTEYRSGGALSAWPDGRAAWGFIHGNWALDNSRFDHGRNYCGVDNELTVLQTEGCFADFTFPAWQHTCQPRQVNALYLADDDPTRPKSYDRGRPVRRGVADEGFLIVHGPLMPYLLHTRRGPRLAIDDGDLASYRRCSPDRLDRWVRAGIGVQGRPDRVFVKLHCHGAADANREALLGGDLDALFSDADRRYNDGKRYRLYHVTAREMYNVILATQADDPRPVSDVRDYVLPHPSQVRQLAYTTSVG
jgi:hypothetical protein